MVSSFSPAGRRHTTRLNAVAIMLLMAWHGVASADPWTDSYALEAANKFGPAAAALEPVLAQWPDHEFALLRRAWLNYQQGRMRDAQRDYHQVLAINPKSLDARLGLTLPLMAQQRWREAAAEAQKVIAVSAWDITAHTRLMACEEAERKWEVLSRHASELAARFPTDATALVYLARAEAGRGDVKKAVATYLQVLERIPAHVEALVYLKRNA